MARIELLMPQMGESIFEATVLGWLKNVGEYVEQDDSLLEIATDKVDTEVPSNESGQLVEMLVNEGDVVKIGQIIAILESEEAAATVKDTTVLTTKDEPVKVLEVPGLGLINETVIAETTNDSLAEANFYSPLVKSIAKEENVSEQELATIQGTGREDRITKDDILNYLKNRSKTQSVVKEQTTVPSKSITTAQQIVNPPSISGGDEIIEMDRMRKMIAERMVMASSTIPHVTSFVEADVTNVVNWRTKHKNSFLKNHGEKLTFTPILVEAIAKALRDYPMMNVSLNGTSIIKKKAINIGMAAALPTGNLIVPVIKNADQLNILGLTKVVNDLATRARNNKLTADDLAGGTYTFSNIGSFGNISGTPIIVQPQVGILALGAIIKKPAVIETPEGDFIGIRHKMMLSHSYDHRVVDGALGGMFVKRVAEYLESFDVNQMV